MPRAKLLALVALAALLAAPHASAHIQGFSQARSLTLGPYNAYVEPQPSDVYANNSLSFSALVSDNATGNYVTNLGATMSLTGPGGWNKSVDMQRDSTGYLLASFILPTRGNYSATFTLHGPNGQDYSSSTTFTAYPDLPIRIQSADLQQDIQSGQRTTLALETDDPITGARVDKVSDLTMDIQRWADDHSVMYTHETVVLKHAGKGLWTYDYTFPKPGMYHLQFQSVSGEINYPDIPILHLYATDPSLTQGASAGGKKVPDVALPLVLAGVALAAGALLRRRS